MTAPYWVIREGKVGGQGRYWGGQVGWVDSPAASFRFRTSAADMILECIDGRIVRVVPKRRATTVTLEHHMASVAMAREAALDEAERACRDLGKVENRDHFPHSRDAAERCADAIAALKGGAK